MKPVSEAGRNIGMEFNKNFSRHFRNELKKRLLEKKSKAQSVRPQLRVIEGGRKNSREREVTEAFEGAANFFRELSKRIQSERKPLETPPRNVIMVHSSVKPSELYAAFQRLDKMMEEAYNLARLQLKALGESHRRMGVPLSVNEALEVSDVIFRESLRTVHKARQEGRTIPKLSFGRVIKTYMERVRNAANRMKEKIFEQRTNIELQSGWRPAMLYEYDEYETLEVGGPGL